MKQNTGPKILLLDIETAPATAYVWKLYDENVGLEQLIEPSRIICWSAKFFGERDLYFDAEWYNDQFLMGLYNLLESADAVVTYNGDKFDLPKITGGIVLAGYRPLSTIPSIDLYRVVKRLGLTSNKLAHVAPLLEIGRKVDTGGFSLWRRVLEGEEKARRSMERYNKQDVRLLERLYKVLRPFVKNHPYIGEGDRQECPNCGGLNLHSRGKRRTKAYFIQKLQCQGCGAWSDGVREKVPNTNKKKERTINAD